MADVRRWPEGFKRVEARIDFNVGHRVGWVHEDGQTTVITHEDGRKTWILSHRVIRIVDISGKWREAAS